MTMRILAALGAALMLGFATTAHAQEVGSIGYFQDFPGLYGRPNVSPVAWIYGLPENHTISNGLILTLSEERLVANGIEIRGKGSKSFGMLTVSVYVSKLGGSLYSYFMEVEYERSYKCETRDLPETMCLTSIWNQPVMGWSIDDEFEERVTDSLHGLLDKFSLAYLQRANK